MLAAVTVLTLQADRVAAITAFLDPAVLRRLRPGEVVRDHVDLRSAPMS